MRISAIAAIDNQRGIGKEGKIPWRIPEDMKHFKEITTGHPVIMGRKTYESMGKPLPNRTNIIITRDHQWKADNCHIVHSLERAIEIASKDSPDEIFIVGGAEIYTLALPKTNRLYMTVIESNFNCDTFFPDYSEFRTVVSKEEKQFNELKYTYITLER